MDVKLKEAIAAVRAGDRATAQQQLTMLLAEKPEEAQGWYLLSLLVDSPQKQAAYLSKTLALDPHHPKAKEQLASLQAVSTMAPTSTFDTAMDSDVSLDLLDQAESDTLPDWLESEAFQLAAKPVEEAEETAVPNDTLPDWLIEPAMPDDELPSLEEEFTAVDLVPADDAASQTSDTLQPQTVKQVPQPPANKAAKPKAKAKATASKGTAGLNIMLGVLVLLAIIVMILLAYLIFS